MRFQRVFFLLLLVEALTGSSHKSYVPIKVAYNDVKPGEYYSEFLGEGLDTGFLRSISSNYETTDLDMVTPMPLFEHETLYFSNRTEMTTFFSSTRGLKILKVAGVIGFDVSKMKSKIHSSTETTSSIIVYYKHLTNKISLRDVCVSCESVFENAFVSHVVKAVLRGFCLFYWLDNVEIIASNKEAFEKKYTTSVGSEKLQVDVSNALKSENKHSTEKQLTVVHQYGALPLGSVFFSNEFTVVASHFSQMFKTYGLTEPSKNGVPFTFEILRLNRVMDICPRCLPKTKKTRKTKISQNTKKSQNAKVDDGSVLAEEDVDEEDVDEEDVDKVNVDKGNVDKGSVDKGNVYEDEDKTKIIYYTNPINFTLYDDLTTPYEKVKATRSKVLLKIPESSIFDVVFEKTSKELKNSEYEIQRVGERAIKCMKSICCVNDTSYKDFFVLVRDFNAIDVNVIDRGNEIENALQTISHYSPTIIYNFESFPTEDSYLKFMLKLNQLSETGKKSFYSSLSLLKSFSGCSQELKLFICVLCDNTPNTLCLYNTSGSVDACNDFCMYGGKGPMIKCDLKIKKSYQDKCAAGITTTNAPRKKSGWGSDYGFYV